MKVWLLCLIIGLMPTMALAGEAPDEYWFCYQMGVITKTTKKKSKDINTLVISNIFVDNYDYDFHKREKQFATAVEKATNGKFDSYFDPHCIPFEDDKSARADRAEYIDEARKREYDIIPIEFRYNP